MFRAGHTRDLPQLKARVKLWCVWVYVVGCLLGPVGLHRGHGPLIQGVDRLYRSGLLEQGVSV